MKKVFVFALALLISGIAFAQTRTATQYPSFIFGHIVWEDESTTQSVRELVKGYQEREIPVSGVIIDSPWETAYNNFEFDTKRYPEYQKLLSDLKSQNIAVILWITSAVNTDDPDYQFALEKGYFLKGFEKYKWWKGTGGLIDYNNPQAMKWWHQRMNKALDLGIDGWKVDGVEGAMALAGIKRQRDYSRAYYSDFFNYSREYTKRPIVIMARGIEEFNEHSMSLPAWVNPLHLGPDIVFAPQEVSFMTWMGDQTPNWDGIKDAHRDFEKSVKAGYLNPGFDIFGYRDGKKNKELFIRWAQFGAFVPMMENGGAAEHRPWMYDDETVQIYRQLAVWHEELKCYLYSLAEEKFLAKKSLVQMQGKNFFLGDSIFVAPILNPGGNASFQLPDGNWRYWYDLSKKLKRNTRIEQTFPLSEYPVYVKEGSLIPLWVNSKYGHLLNYSFSTQDTFWLLPGNGEGTRVILDPQGTRASVSWKRTETSIELSAQGLKRPVVLLVEGIDKIPQSVSSSGKTLKQIECASIKPAGDDEFCQQDQKLFLKLITKQGKLDAKVFF